MVKLWYSPSIVNAPSIESGMLTEKYPKMVVGTPLFVFGFMPSPRIVTAWVMLTGAKEPPDKVITSPCRASAWALTKVCAP